MTAPKWPVKHRRPENSFWIRGFEEVKIRAPERDLVETGQTRASAEVAACAALAVAMRCSDAFAATVMLRAMKSARFPTSDAIKEQGVACCDSETSGHAFEALMPNLEAVAGGTAIKDVEFRIATEIWAYDTMDGKDFVYLPNGGWAKGRVDLSISARLNRYDKADRVQVLVEAKVPGGPIGEITVPQWPTSPRTLTQPLAYAALWDYWDGSPEREAEGRVFATLGMQQDYRQPWIEEWRQTWTSSSHRPYVGMADDLDWSWVKAEMQTSAGHLTSFLP